MWSVWSECVDIYLSSSLVLLTRRDDSILRLSTSPTVPLDDVLGKLDTAFGRRELIKPWRMRVFLSASLCLPVAVPVPEGLHKRSEIESIARAAAASVWRLPAGQADEIVCCFDARFPRLCASMLSGTHDQIRRWVHQRTGQLQCLMPMWAAATKAKVCRPSKLRGLAFVEPDAFTILEGLGTLSPQVASWPGQSPIEMARQRMEVWLSERAEAQSFASIAGGDTSSAIAQLAFSRVPERGAFIANNLENYPLIMRELWSSWS